jgi:hypothetical protein
MSLQRISSSSNVLFLCRLCGTETISQDRLNIFDSNGVALNIITKISYCLGINICDNDYLPKNVCSECVNNVEIFTEFKVNCNNTKNLLLDLTINMPDGDRNRNPTKHTENNQETKLRSNNVEVDNNYEISEQFLQSQSSNVNKPSVKNKKMVSCCNICKCSVCSCKLNINNDKNTDLFLNTIKKESDDIDYESNIFEP